MAYNKDSSTLARITSQPNTWEKGKRDLAVRRNRASRTRRYEALLAVLAPSREASPAEYTEYLDEVKWQVQKLQARGISPTVVVYGLRGPLTSEQASQATPWIELLPAGPFVAEIKRLVPGAKVVDSSRRGGELVDVEEVTGRIYRDWRDEPSFSELRVMSPPSELTMWTTYLECRGVLAQGVTPLVERPVYHPYHRAAIAAARRAIRDLEDWRNANLDATFRVKVDGELQDEKRKLTEAEWQQLIAYRDELNDDPDLGEALAEFDKRWGKVNSFFAERQATADAQANDNPEDNTDTWLVSFKTQHRPDEPPPSLEAQRRAEMALEVAERLGAKHLLRTGRRLKVDFLTCGAPHPGGKEYLSVASMKYLFELIAQEQFRPKNFTLGDCWVDIAAKSGEAEVSVTAEYAKDHEKIIGVTVIGGDSYATRTGAFAQERWGMPLNQYPADVPADETWQNAHVEANLMAPRSVYAIQDPELMPANRDRPKDLGAETMGGVNVAVEPMRRAIAVGKPILVTPKTIKHVSIKALAPLMETPAQ